MVTVDTRFENNNKNNLTFKVIKLREGLVIQGIIFQTKGGIEHWAVNQTSPQSFIITYFYSMAE